MTNSPLADRIRPQTLGDFVGQEHLVGEGKILQQLLSNPDAKMPSLIFWGPPGTGKTTLARIIANQVRANFFQLSAVTAGKEDIKKIVANAKAELESKQLKFSDQSKRLGNIPKTILFLDEIHRFNKAQQDTLLPYVEDGTLTLIGATTENPSFEVISALLSRCRVLVLKDLSEVEIKQIVSRAWDVIRRGDPLGRPTVGRSIVSPLRFDPAALDFLAHASNGDARIALNALELAVQLAAKPHPNPILSPSPKRGRTGPSPLRRGAALSETEGVGVRSLMVTKQHIQEALQQSHLLYDRAGEEHYNTISAFIKAMRASNADAALYYLARMVEAGEDPKFIARRMVIFASEDIGMAQPTALVVANEVFRACETIGYPECAINLAHGAVYLASAKKDRSAYDAYFRAVKDVKDHGNLPIPLNLRNAPTKLMKDLGYAQGYEKYTKESLLPEKLQGKRYYLT